MFPPPPILTTSPPKMGASVQNLCQIAAEQPEMCKIFKNFSCGELIIREELISLVIIGCKAKDSINFLYLVIFFSN